MHTAPMHPTPFMFHTRLRGTLTTHHMFLNMLRRLRHASSVLASAFSAAARSCTRTRAVAVHAVNINSTNTVEASSSRACNASLGIP